MQQLEAELLAQLAKAIDQLLLQAVELIAACRQLTGVQLIFHPDPLEECRFIERRRRIGVVLQQLRLTHAVPREIETRIQRGLMGFPRLAYEAPGVFGDAKFGH